ncbi:AraC family transcriptional regulator [Acidisoma cladoniae]|uniref:AraC family transcriptional regulator n=1 Tax=Acidisoma cladoniae TaxID=3040935 RepID=UPI00254F6698|nr:AraC family transcriptional regulator [Acidisoma sp. PAMC 29798]
MMTAFDVKQTHGILRRPEHRIDSTSDTLGWGSLYASRQREQPYEDSFAAVDDHLIILHLDGPVEVERHIGFGKLKRRVPPGGQFILPGGTDFRVRLAQPLTSVHIYVRDAILRDVAAEVFRGDPAHAEIQPCLGELDPVIEDLARAASHLLADRDPESVLMADYLAHALALRLLSRNLGHARIEEASKGVLTRGQRRQVCDYVQAHLAHPIGLADLAVVAGLSQTSFARLFKRSLGVAPYRYVLLARLDHAKRLLSGSNTSIAAIAQTCGFTHQEHLTRLFHREIGTTPAAYRRGTAF